MTNLFEEARFKAIKYIGISKKTEHEVRSKLKLKGYDEDIISNVTEYLKKLEYIDDKEYIKSYIRQNIASKKYSVFEIIQKLKIKGIYLDLNSPEIIAIRSGDYEGKVVEKLVQGKLKNKDEIQIKNYLYRRGFKI